MIRKALEVPSYTPSAEVFWLPGLGFGAKVWDHQTLVGYSRRWRPSSWNRQQPRNSGVLHMLELTSRGGRWYRNRLRA